MGRWNVVVELALSLFLLLLCVSSMVAVKIDLSPEAEPNTVE